MVGLRHFTHQPPSSYKGICCSAGAEEEGGIRRHLVLRRGLLGSAARVEAPTGSASSSSFAYVKSRQGLASVGVIRYLFILLHHSQIFTILDMYEP